jgi:hypothetical protein
MAYSALPDRRIPYDNDGTVVGWWHGTYGIRSWLSGADLLEIQDADYTQLGSGVQEGDAGLIFFFPERREVTAHWSRWSREGGDNWGATYCHGSNNTTNGLDGTWETASRGAQPADNAPLYADAWRSSIGTISFTGAKSVVRIGNTRSFVTTNVLVCHLYGEKAAGETVHDLIFIDHDTTPGAEFTADEDFGDRPLGTTETRQFRVKNASASKTANTINIQCNDADFAISTDNSTWVVTIDLASLSAGAESATYYVRNTTPAIGGILGPDFARIVATVGSWT